MRRHARLLPLVAACLLARVATGSAECAWVLWELGQVEPRTWHPVTAFSGERACVEVRQVMARERYVFEPDSPKTYATLRCLPDTIDPRDEGE